MSEFPPEVEDIEEALSRRGLLPLLGIGGGIALLVMVMVWFLTGGIAGTDPETACIKGGGTWDAETEVCTFPLDTEAGCIAEGGTWDSATEECALPDDPEAECIAEGGTYDADSGECTFPEDDPEAECIAEGGTWNADSGECIFDETPPSAVGGESETATCECQGADEVCSDGTVTNDSPTCLASCTCTDDLTLSCDDGVSYSAHPTCTEGCECNGPDLFCNDGEDVFEDFATCTESCGCVGPDYVCDDGFTIADEATCSASCSCDGTTLFCNDGTQIEDYPDCDVVFVPPADSCGDGFCGSLENTDLCPEDCSCVDDGVCGPGEGLGCADCGATGGTCGAKCTADSQCSNIPNAVNPACAGGYCWDACACGGDCGDTGPTCSTAGAPSFCFSNADCPGGSLCQPWTGACYCP